jgi:hypothetical protein
MPSKRIKRWFVGALVPDVLQWPPEAPAADASRLEELFPAAI